MNSRLGLVLALVLGGIVGAGLHRALSPPQVVEAPTPARVFARVHPTVFDVRVRSPEARVGAGFAISEHEIITARHLVIDTVDPIEVQRSDGSTLQARVVGTDARTDLALLAVDAVVEPVTIGSSAPLRVGQSVVAVGNPFGLGHSLSTGVVGGMHRKLDLAEGPRVDFMQLSIPLNPGNSGGPIFDLDGDVVGVLTGSHTQGQAIAFAVPIESVVDSLKGLRSGRQITRAFLGIRLRDIDGRVEVQSVVPSSPADRAGLRPGDHITTFADTPVASAREVHAELDRLSGGVFTTIAYRRGSEGRRVEVELADWAEQPTVIAGMTLRPLPGSGGEVVAVRPRSRADRAGVRVDDVVRTVNGLPMQAPADVKDGIASTSNAQLELSRNGDSVTVQL